MAQLFEAQRGPPAHGCVRVREGVQIVNLLSNDFELGGCVMSPS